MTCSSADPFTEASTSSTRDMVACSNSAFTALVALKYRKRLEDHDRGIADPRRQIRDPRFQ
jgi:hypothetical protein